MSEEYEVFETDVAIVGMAAHLPGARNVSEYWKNLIDGVESVRFWSEEELLAVGEKPENIRRKNYVPASAPLGDMEMFDGEFFGFSPKESLILDPQHRHFLMTAWEALESAGHPPEKFDGPIGMFGGCGMGSYFYFHLATHPDLVRDVGLFLLRHTGNDKDFLATRASYLMDLRGPSVGVQTACSTSLVATHLAVQSLINRECDLALAGGVTIELPHRRGYFYHEGEVLSPDGHCHAFDHRGQGTVFGSGAGVVALRRLEDAIDDGDVIHAVIRGSAVNNDGSTKVNYLAPSVDGQSACMVEAYGIGEVDPRTIGYIECHGTGTYLGDPIELSALTQAFRTQTDDNGFCRIGSVKTNIGHLDTAAGVASLIKATMALKEGKIPPTLNFEKPNPGIDFANSPFVVNDQLYDWPAPAEHPRRAAINSLGVGGTNAHVVVQEPPALEGGDEPTRPIQLLTISAKSTQSLEENTRRLATFFAENPEVNLGDVAWTLHHGRSEFDKRRVVAVHSTEEAAQVLAEADPRRVFSHSAQEKTSTVFLCPGGGAHYATMTRDLYETEQVYREHLERGMDLLRERHGIELRPLLFPEPGDEETAHEQLTELSNQLPAIFIVSVAMARLFQHWGVEPQQLMGHSLGENTAAHLAGVMEFEEALGLVVLRGQLVDRVPGSMLSLSLPATRVRELLTDFPELDLGVINAPENCVVSGASDAIERLAQLIEAKVEAGEEIDFRRLAIPTAAHSRMLDPILDEFRAYLKTMTLRAPKIPFPSNVTGTWITDSQATDPEYWVSHLRGTVRFADDVEAVLEGGPKVLIETGPGRTLSSLTKQSEHFRSGGHQTFASVRHRDQRVHDGSYFFSALGRVWACGGDFDWDMLWPDEQHVRVELPTYGWNLKPYFLAPREDAGVSAGELAKLADVEDWGWRHLWKPAFAETLPDDGSPREKHTWLVFMDEDGLGQRLVSRLQEAGDAVIRVYEGDAFAKRDDGTYAVSPERGKEGYLELIADLVQHGMTPDRILHLWLVEAEERFRPGSSLFHHQLERGFFSLFFLAQALADESVPGPLHLTAVTNGLHRVDTDDDVAYPAKATHLGPMRVLGKELEGYGTTTIDVELPRKSERLFDGKLGMAFVDPFGGKRRMEAAYDHLADRLVEDLVAPPSKSELAKTVAYRGEKRYELALEPSPLRALEGTPNLLKERGVYLITGGRGGLGLTMAKHLAETCQARLVLLGRSPLPPRDQWAQWLRQHGQEDRISIKLRRLLAIEDAGGEVLPVAADVTNVEEMMEVRAAAEARFGPIQGILHAAGVVDDDLIALKTQESVEDVFTPKIQGTLVLAEVFPIGDSSEKVSTRNGVPVPALASGSSAETPLDFVVLFSSTSTATASAGQVDYVAANAFLDSFADQHADGPTRVVSVHWGIWNEVGMAAESLTVDHAARAGELAGEQPQHPLLHRRVRDDHGETVLEATYSPERHWILGGHRTEAGHALVPGTGYLELMDGALKAYGETSAYEVEDLFFIRACAVADESERDVRVKLKPTSRGYTVEIRGATELDGRRGWELHAQAHLAIRELAAPGAVPVDTIWSRCSEKTLARDETGIVTPQEKHIRFGKRWRVLREAVFGAREGIAKLALQPEFHAEVAKQSDPKARFALHPALLDIATGWAMDLIEGYEAEHLYVPVGYERVRVHDALPAEIISWVRSAGDNGKDDDFVFFDVTLSAPDGTVLVEVDRLALRQLQGSPDFAIQSRPSPRDLVFEERSRSDAERSPGELQLEANLERGILPDEGTDALNRVLAGPPLTNVFVSSMDLPGLVLQAANSAGAGAAPEEGIKLARPDLDSEYVEPRDAVEKTLVSFWQELLGVDLIGIKDNFFDLGGHSLIAVRLFAKIKKAYQVEFAISVLFEAPTIELAANLIREAMGDAAPTEDSGSESTPSPETSKQKAEPPRPRFKHLVSMHAGEGGPRTPFFLVAGMFGNVMNLRHVAHLIGTDRRFYGLQAAGLYGDEAPHETFEEMATAYLAEIRQVQPRGPYFIGGFSGGGITAFEMAHQLQAVGEEVALIVMLDTYLPLPPPKLSIQDRARIQTQMLQKKGPAYVSEWAVSRWNWELGKLRKRFEEAEPDRQGEQFHNEAIEAAFRRAIPRYAMKKLDADVELVRPPLAVAYDLGEGRLLNIERNYIYPDNGWTEWVRTLRVHEVPGDHDSMVLEPNVRVVARRIRRVIDEAEAKLRARPSELQEAQP